MFSSRVGFFSSAAVITVTGGTLTTSGDYSIRTFSSNGNLVISGGSLAIEYLMVAGGGASGGDTEFSGGGGAGGLLTGSTTLTAGTYVIVRGAAGVYTAGATGGNGGNTTFNGDRKSVV